MGRSPDQPELQTSHTAKVGIAPEHQSLQAQLQAAGSGWPKKVSNRFRLA
jgi:hypothetical protein